MLGADSISVLDAVSSSVRDAIDGVSGENKISVVVKNASLSV